jgi:hypothetical protein
VIQVTGGAGLKRQPHRLRARIREPVPGACGPIEDFGGQLNHLNDFRRCW